MSEKAAGTDKKKRIKLVGWVLGIVCFIIFVFLIPPNENLTQQALNTVGIFLFFVITMIFGSCEMYLSGALACAALVLTKTHAIGDVLAKGFGNSTVWFIAFAYAMTAAVNKTGLLKRLAYKLMTFFPDKWSAQVIALETAGFIINPFIPSGQAKITIMAPITEYIAKADGLEQHSKGAIGLFMGCWPQVAFQTAAWGTSTAYVITAMMAGQSFTFVSWLGITAVWLLIMTFVWMAYVLLRYKPDNAVYEKGSAKKAYAELGPMNTAEKKALFVLLVTVVLWIGGTYIGIDNTTASLIGFALSVLFGLLGTRDIYSDIPWSLLLGMFFLMPIFSGFSEFGISKWLIIVLAPITKFISNPYLLILAVCVITYAYRQIVMDNMAGPIICTALFGSLAVSYGIPLASVTFAAFVSTFIYNVKSISFPWLFAEGALRGWISFDKIKDTAWPYALLNLIGLLASIPLWQLAF